MEEEEADALQQDYDLRVEPGQVAPPRRNSGGRGPRPRPRIMASPSLKLLILFSTGMVLYVAGIRVSHKLAAVHGRSVDDIDAFRKLEEDQKEDVAKVAAGGDKELKKGGKKASEAVQKVLEQRREEMLLKLNNMDMPMRRVKGQLQPCLDLLPPKEIEALQLPPSSTHPDSPITNLRYFKFGPEEEQKEAAAKQGGISTTPSSEMPLFAGKQTMKERDESYTVHNGMTVHCGFAGQRTGFDISHEDRMFMAGCTAVVATCTFGAGDDVYQPIGMTNATLDKVCYVAMWDEATLRMHKENGVAPEPVTRKLGHWRIVIVKNLPFTDQRKNGKIPKMLSHRLFPNARYFVWVDSKSQFRRDPMGVFEALLWRPHAPLAISEHGARKCIYDEGVMVVHKHKAKAEEVAVQMDQYRKEGLPENATFDGRKALAEASVIVREHTPLTNLFMCLWFNEVVRFTARDQLSFGYVLRRLQLLHINMFPVCTRRALVNNIGHTKKASAFEQ